MVDLMPNSCANTVSSRHTIIFFQSLTMLFASFVLRRLTERPTNLPPLPQTPLDLLPPVPRNNQYNLRKVQLRFSTSFLVHQLQVLLLLLPSIQSKTLRTRREFTLSGKGKKPKRRRKWSRRRERANSLETKLSLRKRRRPRLKLLSKGRKR